MQFLPLPDHPLVSVILLGLFVWRITYMLQNEEGPFFVLVKIRKIFGIEHDEDNIPISWPINSVFECLWCLSVWVGLVAIFVPLWLILPFALSGVAILIEEVRKWREPA